MGLVKLTDFYRNGVPEFVNSNDVSRIENLFQELVTGTEEKTVKFLWIFNRKKTVEKIELRHGSIVVMKSSGMNNYTAVQEKPEEVYKLLEQENGKQN